MPIGAASIQLALVEVVLEPMPSRVPAALTDAPPLARRLLTHRAPALASPGDLEETTRWLAQTVGGPPPTLGSVHQMRAEWEFPLHPLITIWMDDARVARADYGEYSATLHWAVCWERSRRQPLPLVPLATLVPEQVDADAGLRDYVLEVAINATAEHLLEPAS